MSDPIQPNIAQLLHSTLTINPAGSRSFEENEPPMDPLEALEAERKDPGGTQRANRRAWASCKPIHVKPAQSFQFLGLPGFTEQALKESGLAPADWHPGKIAEIWHVRQVGAAITNISLGSDRATQQDQLDRAVTIARSLVAATDGALAAIWETAERLGLKADYFRPWVSNVPPDPDAKNQAVSDAAAPDAKSPSTPANKTGKQRK